MLEVEDRDGRRFVELAYGTSANTTANTGDEVHVIDPADLGQAGVHRPTRFVCARRVTVTLDHPAWYINPNHASPIVGALPHAAALRMNVIRGKIRSRRTAVADQRRASWPRPFTVEHRRRRRPSNAVRQ